jgi:hypothetical protein
MRFGRFRPEQLRPATVDLGITQYARQRRPSMKTLLTAAAATALLLLPVGAYAQKSAQGTDAQENFRAGVKAETPTAKRQEILRGETNRNDTTGAAPMTKKKMKER